MCRNCNISSFTSKSALDNHLAKCGNAVGQAEQISEEVDSRLYCKNCLNKSYKSEKDLETHLLSCRENKPFKVEMPNKYNNILKFNKHYMKSEIPFRIYCDFETVNVKENDQKFKQKPSGYSIILVSDFQDIIPNKIIQRRGKSCEETLQMYINDIKNLQSICYNKLRINKKMIPISDNKATNCDWCKKEFNNDYFCNKCYEKLENSDITCHEKNYPIKINEEVEITEKNCNKCKGNKNDINSCHNIKPIQSNKKVCHHNHYSGEFKNFLCTRCNLIEGYKTKFVPVYFHNLCGYDSHLFIKELISNLYTRNNLKDLKKQLKKDPQNEDLKRQILNLKNEIKLTPKFKVLSKTTEEIIALDYGCLRFLDSMKFFQDSLEKVAESLSPEDFNLTRKHMSNDEEKVQLLTKKGIYPYDYIDSFDKFNETDLPSKDKFFSRLRKSGITEEEYQRAKLIWNKFNCKNLGEYSDLYCLSDTLILADCFEKFRKFFLENHEIDPCHSYSTPGLTWEVGLKFTEVELELLTDYDMYLMFEQGRRGGFSGVLGSRKVIANNKYLTDYDKEKLSNFILYLDANNLYGWAMSQKLPTGNFNWQYNENYNYKSPQTKAFCSDYKRLLNERIPFLIECDLQYPDKVKLNSKNFPFLPINRVIKYEELSDYQRNLLLNKIKSSDSMQEGEKLMGKEKKLILDFYDKERYVIHHRMLKFYLRKGIIVTKVHKIITFDESDWLKKYINFNTQQRTLAKTDFEKNIWKLMNNSFYGKTIENVKDRIDFDFCTEEDELRKQINKPHFKGCKKFNDNCIGYQLLKTKTILNKPIYLGVSILDLSKLLMYNFYYEKVDKLWPNTEIIGFDTDSMILNIFSDDIYQDMKSIQKDLDTSEYPKEHLLFSNENKKVIGKFKDELHGELIKEIIFMKSKVYAYKLMSSSSVKKLKGCSKVIINKEINYDDYDKILHSTNELNKKQWQIHSQNHEIYYEEIDKKVLCAFDDKRYCIDSIRTIPHCNDEFRIKYLL